MVYMNIETYDIVSVYNKEDEDKYVEVDPATAVHISLLNKKGYKTRYCCSGHPFINKNYYSKVNHNKHIIVRLASDIYCRDITSPVDFYIMLDGDHFDTIMNVCRKNKINIFYIELNKISDPKPGDDSIKYNTIIRLNSEYRIKHARKINSYYGSYDILKDIHFKLMKLVLSLPTLNKGSEVDEVKPLE